MFFNRCRIYSNESNLGIALDPPFISSKIKELLSSKITCKFSNNKDSNYIIKVKVNTSARSKEPDQYGFFFVYANAELTVVSSKDKKEIFSKSIKQIKLPHLISML